MTTEELHTILVRLAKSLGVWPSWADSYRSMDGEELSRLGLAINRLGGSPNFRVWISLGRHRHVFRDADARTALLLLLGHARGVVLDVGPWARALLDAMSREWTQAANGRVGPDALRCLRETAERRHAAFVDAPQWVHAEGGQLQVRMRSPGDPTARTALSAWSGAADLARYERLGWADTVDDTLAVWHDDHLARGGEPSTERPPWQVPAGGDTLRWTAAAPVGLAEHPTLARLTAAWLARELFDGADEQLAAEAETVIAAKERRRDQNSCHIIVR